MLTQALSLRQPCMLSSVSYDVYNGALSFRLFVS